MYCATSPYVYTTGISRREYITKGFNLQQIAFDVRQFIIYNVWY